MNNIQQLSQELVDRGLTVVFGVSGSGPSYELITALLDRGAEYIPVSHEATAPIAAGVFGFETGRPAAAISIKGPGFVNLLTGITASWFERYPLYAIAEDYPEDLPLERMHKRLPQKEMIKPICSKISSFSQMHDLKDFLTFEAGQEGPHFFELCETSVPAPTETFASFDSFVATALSPQIMENIASAQRPLLILGSLVRRLGLQDAIQELRLPILTSVQAKGLIDERKANAAGIYTGVGKELAEEKLLLEEADLIITVGLRNHEILGIGSKKTFFNFDITSTAESPKPIVVDQETIINIFDILSTYDNWAEAIIASNRTALSTYAKQNDWMPAPVFQLLSSLKFDHGLVLDTGTFCTIGEHFWQASPARPFLGSSNGRNMGISVPSALGFALAHPELPIFCVMGDGGIRYYPSELMIFRKLSLAVCFLYMTDGQFGSIACNIKDGRYSDQILRPAGESWSSIVQGMGIESHIVHQISELSSKIEQWERKGPLFLELPFDSELYKHIAKSIR